MCVHKCIRAPKHARRLASYPVHTHHIPQSQRQHTKRDLVRDKFLRTTRIMCNVLAKPRAPIVVKKENLGGTFSCRDNTYVGNKIKCGKSTYLNLIQFSSRIGT